jgi:phospholipase D1/2
MKDRRWLPLVAALVGLGLLGLVLREAGLSWRDGLGQIERLRDAGPAGLPIYLGIYAVMTWVMGPASWLHGSAGFLYGALPGIAVAWVASMTFGFASYEAARGRLRDPLRRWLVARFGEARLAALDHAVDERGVVAVVLLRLSPLAPFNVVNFMLGLTSVDRRTYLIGTGIGSLSPIGVYATLGAQVSDLATLTETGRASPGATAAVVGTTAVASIGIAWFARRALDAVAATKADQQQPGSQDSIVAR